jgi:hypothetical protein
MPLQPVTCANFCRALSCCAGVRPNPMSGYFKIPEYLIPTLLDKRGEVVKDADGKPKKDVRGLEKLIVLFFEANRAHIIGRDEANLLTIPGHPCAISDGTREIRSNRGVFVLRAIRRIRLTSARSLSSRMSPRHPQSGGDSDAARTTIYLMPAAIPPYSQCGGKRTQYNGHTAINARNHWNATRMERLCVARAPRKPTSIPM